MAAESIKLYPSGPKAAAKEHHPSFPTLLQTPSGLALLELQGMFNLPNAEAHSIDDKTRPQPVPVGRLEFPEYNPGTEDPSWMRSVHMYVGQHQRLTGEVKKLPRAMAIVRRRNPSDGGQGNGAEELEVAEVIKYKLVFSHRPEPVGTEQLLG